MIGECVQRRTGAPAVRISRWDILWPTPSTYSDLSRRFFRGDKVVQHKTEVSLEDEEDLDDVDELAPAGGGGAAEPVDYYGGHDGGGEKEKSGVSRRPHAFIWMGDPGERERQRDEWKFIIQCPANQRKRILQDVATVGRIGSGFGTMLRQASHSSDLDTYALIPCAIPENRTQFVR